MTKKQDSKYKLYKNLINSMVFFLVPILLFYLMEGYEHLAWEEVRPLAQLYNVFLFELIAGLLFFLTGSGKVALRIETVTALLYGLVNHYVMAFRSTPFVPWDIFSVKTAVSVAGNYDFTPTRTVIFCSVGFLVIFAVLHFMELKASRKWLWRWIPAGCVGLIFVGFVNLLGDTNFQNRSRLYPYLFTPAHMTKVNGMAVTFAMNTAFVYVERPEGYSVEKAEAILEKYQNISGLGEGFHTENGDSNATAEKLPNIIVIMNEAFSDPAVLGDFTTNMDYMPFIHSLQNGAENTITGNLKVSVCGGNTANSEFEFLTGHTMDFFPVGSIPYQQYITKEIPSVASQLEELGYATYGMHPYNASGWKRDEIYPLLGLRTNYFSGDFHNRSFIRKYTSDRSAYKKIIETFEEKDSDTPLFVFQVTMQNHGGYTEEYEYFTSDIFIEEFESPALSQYLTLMKVSDEAFQELIAYFSNVEEETMIVFFGDHQPNDSVVRPILQWNKNLDYPEGELRYIVPYVIWANYDIDEGTNLDTDISFLSARVIREAGISNNAYQNFLLAYEKALNTLKESEQEQETVENPQTTENQILEQRSIIKEYELNHEILQYYFMFDYEKEQE